MTLLQCIKRFFLFQRWPTYPTPNIRAMNRALRNPDGISPNDVHQAFVAAVEKMTPDERAFVLKEQEDYLPTILLEALRK